MKCLMELDSPRYGLTWKEKLAYLGYKFSAASEGDSARVTLKHIFEPGMYIREMAIPAEMLFIGRPHLMGHRCELVSGKILLITEDAKTHMEAPAELWSKPGYMMCLYSKTAVVGRTYHPFQQIQHGADVDVRDFESQIFGSIDELVVLGEKVRQKIHSVELLEQAA